MEHARKLETELKLNEEKLAHIRRATAETVNSIEKGEIIIRKIGKLTGIGRK
jgi:DNA-binding XRE family transcriptional regulator